MRSLQAALRARIPVLTTALLASILPSSVHAGSVDAGRQTFASNCISCHGTPPNNLRIPAVMQGANNPTLIRQTINNNPSMRFLSRLSDAELANIATYLAKPNTTDADRMFDWGQSVLPTLLTPSASSATNRDGFYFRFYPTTNIFVGTKDGDLYFMDGNSMTSMQNLGKVNGFLGQIEAVGF